MTTKKESLNCCGVYHDDEAELAEHMRRSHGEVEPHYHTCQQCDKVIGELCYCAKGNTTNVWCSARCKEAYDL